ncbi:MAG: hypothetical protein KKD01_10530 [Proteobacteria bacterium]|nr:hypothetical protein [Pseudomonadota bacterium]MBU1455150.1 hypothetical protein [Pseudomonadota bacterium]
MIAKSIIPPSPRPYTDHHAYCLHFGNNTYACGLCQAGVPCMDRVPDHSEG